MTAVPFPSPMTPRVDPPNGVLTSTAATVSLGAAGSRRCRGCGAPPPASPASSVLSTPSRDAWPADTLPISPALLSAPVSTPLLQPSSWGDGPAPPLNVSCSRRPPPPPSSCRPSGASLAAWRNVSLPLLPLHRRPPPQRPQPSLPPRPAVPQPRAPGTATNEATATTAIAATAAEAGGWASRRAGRAGGRLDSRSARRRRTA